MAGLPTTILVELDDGSGAYPFDISGYVDISDDDGGIEIKRGQDSEGGKQASELTLKVNNADGRFTLGSTVAYNTQLHQRIRVTFTVGGVAVRRFNGYVEEWPQSWEGGRDRMASVRVNALDRRPMINRRPLRSIVEETILSSAPSAFWALSEPITVAVAVDTSGKSAPSLDQRRTYPGSTAPVAFGQAADLVDTDTLTSATFSGGAYLTSATDLATQTAVSCFFSCSASTHDVNLVSAYPSTGRLAFGIKVLTAGQVQAEIVDPAGGITGGPSQVINVQTPASYVDGLTHHAACRVRLSGGTTYLDLFVDGALIGTSSVATTAALPAASTIVAGSQGFVGDMAHVVTWATAPSNTQIGDIATSGTVAKLELDPTDGRMRRLLHLVGIADTSMALESGKTTVMAYNDITGAYLADLLDEVARAEGGEWFFNGDGVATFWNREHRGGNYGSKLTMDSDAIDRSTQTQSDMVGVINQATGDRGSTGATGDTDTTTQVARNQPSIDQHDVYPDEQTYLVLTDAEVLSRVQWTVGAYGTPRSHIPGLLVDLLTQTTAVQKAAQAIELGDKVTVSGLPGTAAGDVSEQSVEGWTETLKKSSWTIAFQTTAWAPHEVWILEDFFYGALDAHPLGY